MVVSVNPNGNKITYVNKPKNELTKPRLCRVPDCSEVGISEFKLVNGSRELVNYQFELGPDIGAVRHGSRDVENLPHASFAVRNFIVIQRHVSLCIFKC